MKALVFKQGDPDAQPRLERNRPLPSPAPGEALVRVLRAGVCATDLEIVRGYVRGFDGVLGHEFVGVVEEVNPLPPPPSSSPSSSSSSELPSPPSETSPLLGARVVADINCRPATAAPMNSFADDGDENEERRLLARNHEPNRTVLGIVGRDGAFAEKVCVPAANLHVVPAAVSDGAAAFAEPLAAALRVSEQGLVKDGDSVAVVGDGRLGLLVAAVLSLGVSARTAAAAAPSSAATTAGTATAETAATAPEKKKNGDSRAPRPSRLVHFGRRAENLAMVPKRRTTTTESESTTTTTQHETVVVPRGGNSEEGGGGGGAGAEALAGEQRFASSFDVVVEASGSSSGIKLALALARPLGTVVLKTTCAPPSASASSPSSPSPSSSSSSSVVYWADVANDAVVNEKRLVGSRCGPLGAAVRALAEHEELRALVESMVRAEFPLERGVEALRRAAEPGALKVAIVCNDE